ncbi:M14 family zinc carboxypeptidase, partial [uncultured Algibacter sp.]|uniref:M14 family zinc carboxypeptidase n=1 Tax=uncultured Algibacter sp. TaxID=298659 RepID=UPI00261925EC
MKNFSFALVFLASTLLGYSQNLISKRIKINNPSKAQLLKVKDAGIDLSCGAVFTGNSLILELESSELNALKEQGIFYSVLVEDLIEHYKKKSEIDLPVARAQLQAKKSQTLANKSLSTKSESIDNFIQYEGCTEVNWAVPTNFNLGSMGGCLTYSEVLAELDQMRALYPNLISVKTDASPSNQVTHGNSFTNGGQYSTWSGQTIYYVRISDNPDTDEANEPESLYSGMTHSREVSSLMNLMYYMWYILENYNSDAGIKNLVDNHEMYFIPVANPDGLLWNEQIAPSGGGLQRKNLGPYNTGNNNLRGVDLNRNYDYFWGPNAIYGGSSGTQSSNVYRGPSAFSEPETQIVRDFSATRSFKTAMNHHATSNLIPHAYNGYPNAPASGREAEYHKFCNDMTRFNRYIYGEAPDILTIANGDMSDWMLGGVADVNGSNGSGQGILALAPENGSWISSDGEGSFWPNATKIVEIAQRAVRMNFVNAYHSGKFAQFHDLNTTDINTTSGNLEFGIEYLGQTLGNITLNITPVSSNITSITPPPTQSGWSKLEQRTVTAAYTLDTAIQPNDEIEFRITLSNDDGYVMYQANIIKLYNPSVLFIDNPDIDNLTNWTASGGSWGTTSDSYSGTTAITDSPSGAYANNQSTTLTLNSGVNLSSASASVVQFFAKWDIERNFDYVQIEGSTDGSTWIPLCGKYSKPGSSISTNRYSSGNSSNTSTGKSTSDQNNQPTGESIYDADTMDKWVMEEILIDGTENSFLVGATNARFRFVFDSDNTNRADGYPTTFDGFIFDDFKVISQQTPCALSVPTGLVSSNVTTTDATISWDNIASATYDLRYRVVGAPSWIDVNGLSAPTTTLTNLATLTDYEVQVRSNCGTTPSSYTASINFTTLDVQLNYCASASTDVSDEFISRVQLNTIDNTSGAQFYSDFTNISTSLEKGNQYSISITPTWTGQVFTEAYSVWIDYNRDGDFEDAGEQVFTQSPTNATLVSGNFTVPSSASENSTRMRVSMQYNAIPTSCQTFQYGEVEDYTIVIEAAGPDTTAPVITLNGASSIDVNQGAIYTDLGATAIDNVDGDISANITVGGDTVDTGTIGAYLVTYNVNDTAGNNATEVIRTVNVVVPSLGCSGGIDTYPYAFGFEGSVGTWTQSSNDDLDWLVNSGTTPSNNTGPSGAIQGSDYIYIEASGNGNGFPDKRAIITSPCFDFSSLSEAEFSFAYHMFGAADMGTIDLEISTDDGATWASIWNQSGNQGNSWLTVNINLNAYVGGGVQLRFNRFVGSTWQADIALDDINLTGVEGIDTTAPVITLNGNATIDLNVGDTYTEQGATATDDLDGDITAGIVIGGVVDTNIGGTYLITYDVSDAAGNAATQVVRTVNVIPDTTAPVIT